MATSETGYNNDDLTVKWFAHFQRFSAKRQEGVYGLLLLDGFGLHCTKEFLDYCDQHKIIVFCLSPHSSHLLQPLDVVVFQPPKYYHVQAVEKPHELAVETLINQNSWILSIPSVSKPSNLRLLDLDSVLQG